MMRVNSPGPDGACGAACDGGSTDGATGLDAIGVAGGNGAVLDGIDCAGMVGGVAGAEAGSDDNAFSSCVNPPAEGAGAGGADEG